MFNIFLQRRLLAALHRVFNLKKDFPTIERFLDYFVKNERGIFLYRGDAPNIYRQRLTYILEDSSALTSEGKRTKYYINLDEEKRNMELTERGRKFITWMGFLEIWFGTFPTLGRLLFALIAAFLSGLFVANW